MTPDRTILLDLDPAIGSMRNVQAQDYMEQETINFHNRVREGYLSLAKAFTERWLIVDALQEEGIIVDLVWTDLKKRIRG